MIRVRAQFGSSLLAEALLLEVNWLVCSPRKPCWHDDPRSRASSASREQPPCPAAEPIKFPPTAAPCCPKPERGPPVCDTTPLPAAEPTAVTCDVAARARKQDPPPLLAAAPAPSPAASDGIGGKGQLKLREASVKWDGWKQETGATAGPTVEDT